MVKRLNLRLSDEVYAAVLTAAGGERKVSEFLDPLLRKALLSTPDEEPWQNWAWQLITSAQSHNAVGDARRITGEYRAYVAQRPSGYYALVWTEKEGKLTAQHPLGEGVPLGPYRDLATAALAANGWMDMMVSADHTARLYGQPSGQPDGAG